MGALRQAVVLALLAVLPAAIAAWWQRDEWPADSRPLAPFEVTAQQVQGWGRPVLWVDARDANAFAVAHVPEALPLDPARWDVHLENILEAWQPGTPVVVYCAEQACATSREVAERLRRDLGSDEVYFLRGGFEAWQREAR